MVNIICNRSKGSMELPSEPTRTARGMLARSRSVPSHLLARLAENATCDIAFAARTLRRNLAFTAVTVLILAIGIGVNTTIFRFVSALLLQPPRVADAGRLFQIWNVNPKAPSVIERYVPLSYPDYAYYRDHNRSVDGMLAFDGDPNTVSWM